MKQETLRKAIKINEKLQKVNRLLEKMADKNSTMLIGFAVPVPLISSNELQWIIDDEERKVLINLFQRKKEELEKELADQEIKSGNKFKGQVNGATFEIKAVYKPIYDGNEFVDLVDDKGNKRSVLKKHFKHFRLALINEDKN